MPFTAALLLTSFALGSDAITDLDAKNRLSIAWSRSAIKLVADPTQPSPASFQSAIDVALAAAELTPTDSQAWRVVQGIAETSDDGLPSAQAALRVAIDQLSRLDASDSVIRLARLSEAAERGMASENRVAAYEKLLQPSARQRVGNQIASRLSFDLALLQKRRGDSDGWNTRLREAVSLDPNFPTAAEALAGFEAGSGASTALIANALVTAITADPGNISSLYALARICMREGLYDEADHLVELAAQIGTLDLDYVLVDDMIAMRVLAQWGMGKHEEANKIAGARQSELNAILRRRMGDSAATDRREDEVGPRVTLPSSLACVRAAACKSGALPNAEKVMQEAIISLTEDEKSAGTNASAVAAIRLQKAWMLLTIGSSADVKEVQPLLDLIQTTTPLNDAAKTRFRGWLKLRANQPEAALAELQPIAEMDTGARVGVGLAQMALGRTKESAVNQLAVARANRDTAIGLYASDRVFDIVKSRPTPTPEATAIREAITRMPKQVWKLATDQGQALLCSATFGTPLNAFDSIPLTITLQNRSGLTLAILPSGPIESRAALLLNASVIGKRPISLPPWIFPIDRKLQLKPLETLSFEVDMARTPLADVLLADPLSGAIIESHVVSNFRLTIERVQAGFMGNISESAVLRSPSLRVNAGWREDALSEIRHPDNMGDTLKLVMLAYDLVAQAQKNSTAPPDAAWNEITEAWKKLSAPAQAWTLMVLPKSKLDLIAPLLEAAKASTDSMVRMSYLLRWVESPDDVMLAAAVRSGGRLASVAEGVKALLQSRARDAADVNQQTGGGGVMGGDH